jgi:hypothetical protein
VSVRTGIRVAVLNAAVSMQGGFVQRPTRYERGSNNNGRACCLTRRGRAAASSAEGAVVRRVAALPLWTNLDSDGVERVVFAAAIALRRGWPVTRRQGVENLCTTVPRLSRVDAD